MTTNPDTLVHEQRQAPSNGILSGMVLAWGTAIFVIGIGFFYPHLAAPFDSALSLGFLDAFMVSVLLMFLHKVESYFTLEYEQCPVYATTGRARWAQDSREAVFLAFCGTFLGLALAIALMLRGGYWPLLILAIWMAQGVHEWHHSAKSLTQGSYYSGTVTGLMFVVHVNMVLFPEWYSLLHTTSDLPFYAYYAVQPVFFVGFVVEHHGWLLKNQPQTAPLLAETPLGQ